MSQPTSEQLLDRLAESIATAQSARVRSYLEWGKDHYELDRILGERIVARYPGARTAVQASRAFHRDAIEALARSGVQQYLDIGAGFNPSVHLVAQREVPDAQVIYVDHDPVVLCHGRAMSVGEGVSWFYGDLSDLESIIEYARQRFDFAEPVAVSLVGVVEHIVSQSDSVSLVRALLSPLPSGSVLVLCAATPDHAAEQIDDIARLYGERGIPYRPRTREQISAHFERLALDEPGIFTPLIGKASESEVSTYAAIGRKP
ncbi:SAM-dependent methyltransferase [Nocardia sp. BSTN01]|uniref:SAM-dependent methyltransferase n=1 Tax=Nocardia sp. BSTN01 TaxID=2783665 RepID=UPI00188FC456|nr:SAM-dependent methyltransferase [Nocardia sp. BSTN01]MBF5002411.1 SAM-dependent methyltransferase [Nocardia sp. BSTN01]